MMQKHPKKLLIKSKDRELINELRRIFSSTEISINNNNTRHADLILVDKREGRDIPIDTKWGCKIICIVQKISEKEIEKLSLEGADHILTLPEFKY